MTSLPTDYPAFLDDLKNRIRQSQVKAALAVNSELVMLYWQIGTDILKRQNEAGWGAKIIQQLSDDLRKEFPEMKGLSRSNLQYMRSFSEAWPDFSIVQQLVGQIPWGHNLRIIEQVKSSEQRLWYVKKTIEHGWSRAILEHQIETKLFERQGKAITNFEKTLPAPQSELAHQLLKDPYSFDFLSLSDEAKERDLHKGLLEHIRKFLLELGTGFAFVGSEYHLEVGGEDFYVDLLFYHLQLRCYVVIELKMTDFKPEYAGKLNFYLAVIDDIVRHPDDNPTIGLILCKGKNRVIAEYSLNNISSPIGVSNHGGVKELPDEMKKQLPSIEALEEELSKDDSDN